MKLLKTLPQPLKATISAFAVVWSCQADYWKDVGGVYDGSYTNEQHWSLGFVPDIGSRAYIGYNVNKTYTVTMPDGVYTNFAKFAPIVTPGNTVTIDGQNTTFRHPELTDGTYNTSPFCLIYNSTGSMLMEYSVNGATPNPTTSPNLEFTEFLFDLSSEKAGHCKAELKKGTYDFLHPCGHTWTSTQSPTMYFFGNNANATAMDHDEVVIGKGVTFYGSPRMVVYGNATTNLFRVLGNATFGYSYWPAHPNGEKINEGNTLTEFSVEGPEASASFSKKAALTDVSNGAGHFNRLVARDGGTLTLTEMGMGYGRNEILADGGTVIFGAGNQSFHTGNSYEALTIAARNGGELVMDHGGNGIGMYLGKGGNPGHGLCHVTVSNATLRIKSGGKMNLYNGTATFGAGAVVENNASINFASNADTPLNVLFDGATVTNNATLSMGGTAPAHVTIRNSTFYTTASNSSGIQQEDATVDVYDSEVTIPSGGKWYVGYSAGKTATLNVHSGTFKTAATTSIQLEIGWMGTGRLNVYGGTLNLGRLRIGSSSTTGTDKTAENVLDVEGGLVNVQERGNGAGVCANYDANRTSRIILNGGVLRCYRIYKTAGAAYLEADGGTIQFNNDSENCVRDLNGLTVGPKGLTIDNDGHSVSIGAAIADKAAGTGRLMFTGGGTTKYTGSLADVSTIVADEGTVDLSELPTAGFGSLVATNTAVLKLDPAKTISIFGGMKLENFRVAFSSAVSLGETHDLFAYKTPLSKASQAAIYDGLAVAGVPAGATVVFDEVEKDGGFVLQATVRKQNNIVLSAPTTATVADDRLYRAADKVTADVARGAELTVTGAYGHGQFAKEGEGTLVLDNKDNLFLPGFLLLNGTLKVGDPSGLGTGTYGLRNGVLQIVGPADADYGDRFAFAQESKDDHVIADVRVDAKMAMPPSLNQVGGFTKRGPGRLTFEVEGKVAGVNGTGTHDVSKGFWSQRESLVYPLLFDDVTGLMTNGTYGALNVCEGELRIVGKGEGATVQNLGAPCVAMPTGDGSAMPGLWLDNVCLTNTGEQYFFLASCLENSTPDVPNFAHEPYLVLTNHATLCCSYLHANRLSDDTKLHTHVDIVDSSLVVNFTAYPNRANKSEAKATWNFRNSTFYTPRESGGIGLFRDFTMTFDNSVFARNDALDPSKMGYEVATLGSSTCTMNFRNGSIFSCRAITPPTSSMSAYHPITLRFDDSEWIPAKDADYTFEWVEPEKILIVAENAGLKLPVSAGRTWTMKQPVTGDGDLVNSGTGTLVLGAGVVQYDGVTRCESGTVDLGSTAQAVRMAGAGRFVNGTVTAGGGIVIEVDDKYQTLAAPALSGIVSAGSFRVDLGRTAENPLAEPFRPITVCTYEGEAPDVSGWRLKGTGLSNVRGVFTAANGVVTVTPECVGVLIIVR